ncbi:MAG: SusC/RagA family TonB-linked outer membrane protein [Chitinophagaceae bacterium]
MNSSRLQSSILTALLLLLFYLPSWAQTLQVTGKTTDPQGNALQGVTIQVKGGQVSAASGADGRYSINVPSSNAVLVFSYVGFATREIPVNGRTSIDLSLTPSDNALEDVVVIGYGTQKKSDVTGAVTKIGAKTLEERPVTNALQALQGKAAGVNVSSNMKPGETPSVRIRGTRSISSPNEPLYVIDGIPMISALGVSAFSMNDINPNDIASIEVLKDASATAIYGSRGANGVILISTKKGTKGKVTLNYNASLTFDSYKSLTDWMDGGQWIDRWREALINGRNYQSTTNTNLNQPATIGYPDPFLDRDKMGLASDQRALESVWMGYEWDDYGVTPSMRATTAAEQALGWPAMVPVYNSRNIRSYDWLADAVRTGVTQNHQVALSSGSENSKLYVSFGYNNQLGVQRDQDFERFNINLNGEITPKKWFTLGISTMASLSKQNFGISANSSNTGSKDLYSRAMDQFPYALPRDENGDWVRNPGGNLSLWNPLIDIDQSVNERRASAIMANTFAEVKFTPWLKYRINFGAQMRNFRNGAWTGPDATGHLTARPNTASQSRDENFGWVMENLLFVDKSFGENHKLGVTLLQSSQKSRREGLAANVSGTVIPISYWYDLASNNNGRPDGYGSSFTENTLFSYMARVNYTFMDKYLLTASGRYDGSSVLAPGNKWDFFPSFALAWKMQDEPFLRNITWLTELKPRFGYGVTGNSSVPPYTTSGPLSRNPYVFGSSPAIGYLPQLVQSPTLSWEQTAQLNVGLDFSILNNRISGSLEWYKQNTSNQLFRNSLNPVSGYVEKFENLGEVMNRGVEITLNSMNIDKKDFRWNMEVNVAFNNEEIVELVNGKEDMLAQRLFIGQPINVFFHYDNAGIWQNTAKDLEEMAKFNANGHRFYPGMIKVVDQNGDYRINGEDYTIRGSGRPKWTGGITNTFTYKNWSLNSFIYARVGQTYFGGYPNSYGGTFPNGRVENDVWGWDNPGGRWPLPVMGAQVENFTPAMQFNDGTFFVVRNISLTYDLPSKLLGRASIKTLQLNAQVLNPFIFGGDIVKMGLNPDDETNWASQSQANSNNTSPLGGTNNNTILPQSVVFGVRLGF